MINWLLMHELISRSEKEATYSKMINPTTITSSMGIT